MSGGGKGKKATVGYRYYLDMHMGLCHGPIDNISRIEVDRRIAWTGNTATEGLDIDIDKGELFGGDAREGGIIGTAQIQMGGPTQDQNLTLMDRLAGDDTPAFRGVVCCVLDQCYMGNNPYLKPWSFRAQRIHVRSDGTEQWYDEKAAIDRESSAELSNYFYVKDYLDGVGAYNSQWWTTSDDLPGNAALNDPDAGTFWRFANDTTGTWWVSVAIDVPIGDEATMHGDITLPDAPFATTYFKIETRHDDSTTELIVNGENMQGRMEQTSSFFSEGYFSVPAGTEEFSVRHTVIQGVPSGTTSGYSNGVRFTLLTPSEYREAEGIERECGDMNPAHIIRECLTDASWGMGYNDADIDDVAFMYAADVLWDEYMGISLTWTSEMPIEDFIMEILRHIDGVLYVDRVTGKFVLKLIRGDYEISDLIVLNEENVSGVTDARRPTVGELTASVTVQYWDAGTGEDGSVTQHNQALFELQTGGGNSTTVQYPGFTVRNLASRVALRDLKALSTPLLSCTIMASRDAEELNVGDAFIFDWPDLDIDSSVMRVQQLGFGDGRDNTVIVHAVQDVFTLPGVFDVNNDPSDIWVDPTEIEPEPAAPRMVAEAPYYELATSIGEANANEVLDDDPDAGYILVAAGRDSVELNAALMVDAGLGYNQSGNLDFCPYGFLVDDIWYTTSTIYIENGNDLDIIEPGSIAQIGEELVQTSAAATDSSGTFVVISRGILDTTPAEHPAGTRVIFWGTDYATDAVPYTAAESIDVKLRTRNGANILSLDQAPEDTVTMDSRAIRPYPPGQLQVDSVYYPVPDSAGETTPAYDGLNVVTWAHRDRLQQTDPFFYSYTDGDIGPEPGTEYIVRADAIMPGGGLTVDFLDVNVGSATSYTFGDSSGPNIDVPSGAEFVRIKVYSVRDGYESWQPAIVVISNAVTGSGDVDVKVLIDTITNPGSGEFDFTSIPSGYNRLIIEGYVQSSVSADAEKAYILFNSDDTDANYFSQATVSIGATLTSSEEATPRIGFVAGDTAEDMSPVRIVIEGYADTSLIKSAVSRIYVYRSAGSEISLHDTALYHDSMTAAISRVRIRTDNHSTDTLSGVLRLYGES